MPEPFQRLAKMPSTLYIRHDLADDAGHELEVVRAERAGYPGSRHRPMAVRLAVGLDRDPVRVSVLKTSWWAAWGSTRAITFMPSFRQPVDHFAKGVAVAEELAAVVQRNLGRIEGHAAARAEANRIGVNAFVIVEPERRFVVARIVLDEGQLCPSHRTVVPALRGALLSERGTGRRQNTGVYDQFTSIDFHISLCSPECVG